MNINDAIKEIILEIPNSDEISIKDIENKLIELSKTYSISGSELMRVFKANKSEICKEPNAEKIIEKITKDRQLLKETIKETFRGWISQYTGQFGQDSAAIANNIAIWISDANANGFSNAEFCEIKDILAKDAQFVSKAPKFSDFLSIRKRQDIFKTYGDSEKGNDLVEATKRMSKTFDFRYSHRWTKPDLSESNERIEAWIKHFILFNISAESVDKACEMAAKMSDFNKFPPSIQDFTLVCKMAMCDENIPGPHEAFLIASGLVRNKEKHPLVTYAAIKAGEYELRNGKINREAFINVYQNAIFEYAASGEVPAIQKSVNDNEVIEDSNEMPKDKLLNIIDNLLVESEYEQYY